MRRNLGRLEGTVDGVLRVVGELLSGGRVSRHTLAESRRISLPTADRWLVLLDRHLPGLRAFKVGKTVWFEMIPSPEPTRTCKPAPAPASEAGAKCYP